MFNHETDAEYSKAEFGWLNFVVLKNKNKNSVKPKKGPPFGRGLITKWGMCQTKCPPYTAYQVTL